MHPHRSLDGFARSVLLVTLAALLPASVARAQLDPSWTEPVEPFRIAEGLYYVGTKGLSSFLLVSPEGHILIDTGLAQNTALIRASIEKLGFEIQDVEILLSSHAHFDHVAGHAEMARLSGAQVLALGKDADALRTGTDLSALDGPDWAPVPEVRAIADGEVVTLGPLRLTAHHTPGHTQGCTTWTTQLELDGMQRDIVFIGGTSVNTNVRLLDSPRHPEIVDDYERTFRVLKKLPVDVFLAQHPMMFEMENKARRLASGETPSPFLDAQGYQEFVSAQEQAFRSRLEQERAAAE